MPDSPARARRFVSRTMAAWEMPEPCVEGIRLCVSELVTNAVRHVGGRVRVRVSRRPGEVLLEVTDSSGRRPVRREPALEESGGRGLLLVDRLGTAWGVDAVDGGKTVWVTLPG